MQWLTTIIWNANYQHMWITNSLLAKKNVKMAWPHSTNESTEHIYRGIYTSWDGRPWQCRSWLASIARIYLTFTFLSMSIVVHHPVCLVAAAAAAAAAVSIAVVPNSLSQQPYRVGASEWMNWWIGWTGDRMPALEVFVITWQTLCLK